MACYYNYKGRKFSSELALDDFMLEQEDFFDKYKDIVFLIQPKPKQQHTFDLLTDDYFKYSQNANDTYAKYRQEHPKGEFSEDGEEIGELPPYIGVNKFLSSVTMEDDRRLMPEFIDDLYWKRAFERWKNGEFTESEIEEFELDEKNLPKITETTKLPDGRLAQDVMREQMTKKWEWQGRSGTAVHEVLLLYFSRYKNDAGEEVSVFDLENPKDYIVDHISNKNKPYLNAIDDIIKYGMLLKSKLQLQFGKNAIFFPEYLLSGDAVHPKTGLKQTLIGIADLLIIDENGAVHILDYKTSVKSKHSVVKKMSYDYQLATYKRMLELYGINTYLGKMMIAPLLLENFKKNGDKYSYDGVKYDKDSLYHEITMEVDEKKWSNIDLYMPTPFKISLKTQDVLEKKQEWMDKCFPHYSSDRLYDIKSITKMLKARKLLKKNDNGDFVFKTAGMADGPITSKDEAEFVQKVLEFHQGLRPKRQRAVEKVKIALMNAINENTSEVDWPRTFEKETGVSATWLKDTMAPYCKNNVWEVYNGTDNVFELLGFIILKNKITHHIDIIRVSTLILDANYREGLDSKLNVFTNRLGLTGTFEADVVELSKSDSLMLEVCNGNIELMETMAILNCTGGLENQKIGNIKIVNPYQYKSIAANNEELLYCFNALNKFNSMGFNLFDNGTIKLASKYDLAFYKYKEIMEEGNANEWKDAYRNLAVLKSTSVMDENVDSLLDTEEKIEKLRDLLNTLKSNPQIADLLERVHADVKEMNQDHIMLSNLIETAIADLRGVRFRLLLGDHSKYLENVIKNKGVSGTYTDNPGNLNSDTLNTITKLVTEAYLNTRDEIGAKVAEVRNLVKELKESKGFDYLKENVGFNQTALYKNMIVERDGDLLFLKLDALVDPAERKFLKHVLDNINKERFPKLTDEERALKEKDWDTAYYRVPLCKGSSDSLVSSRGLLKMLREKLSHFNPKTAILKSREKLEGIYEALTNYDDDYNEEVLFKMTNMFDRGEESTERRLNTIKQVGIENLERNLETLLLKHQFAYAQLRNINQVFPIIKAAMIHLANQGIMLNKELSKDMQYLSDYIKNKVQNKSIVSPDMKNINHYASMIKRAASLMVLAFSPVQAIYLPLQGLWQDIRLMISKPGGNEAFTFTNFKTALSLLTKDLFDYSGKPTIFSLMNEIYGINDMDMNLYIDRITKNKKGFWNFENLCYKFASRPDYYNRFAIFTSLMLSDGCWDAHTIVDGRLKYDWKLDKRFSKFAADPKSNSTDPEFIRLKSLYYTVAQLFVNEHAKNFDGTDFKLDMSNPMPLPRAYTNKHAESIKSLSDDIYGYYSHEKKSLIMATTVGSLWLQFKTYWSGKKNLYLAPGKVRLKGHWDLVSETVTKTDENGNEVKELVKYYYQVDSNGNIQFDLPPTTLETIAPVMLWKGEWQEGILVTMADVMAESVKDPRHMILHFTNKWNNEDENLRNAYRSNMKLFGYDIIMFAVVGSILGALLGDWSKKLKDDNKKHHNVVEGLAATAANVACASVKNSFMDLNFAESIGSPIYQWTPFAFEWTKNQWSNFSKVATGDEDFYDGLVKISSTGRVLKPFFDSVKPDMFRTKQEGGTWESATARKNREKKLG